MNNLSSNHDGEENEPHYWSLPKAQSHVDAKHMSQMSQCLIYLLEICPLQSDVFIRKSVILNQHCCPGIAAPDGTEYFWLRCHEFLACNDSLLTMRTTGASLLYKEGDNWLVGEFF